ncbi:MAG: 3-dehydroquinate dehydratase II [bacterium P3]|nr:MAG: 3-dehydroquinate dehydratase II [bacterium P3]KWW40429.1 MAG: 3-dehydroquinate dehydratase II [bacterium F083]
MFVYLYRIYSMPTTRNRTHTMKRIEIVNGPNLNLTGIREPQVYGQVTMEEMVARLRKNHPDAEIGYYQSNVEGELINRLHAVGFSADGIILNAGGYTHTSVALHDAVAAITTPVVEVHISNIFAREEYRRHSLLSDVCRGVICGLGMAGYRLALESFLFEV